MAKDKKVAKKAPPPSSSSSDDSSSDSSSSSQEVVKKGTKVEAKTTKAAPKKDTKKDEMEIDSDDSSSDSSSSSSSSSAASKKKAPAKKADKKADKKVVKKAASSSSDSDDSSDSSSSEKAPAKKADKKVADKKAAKKASSSSSDSDSDSSDDSSDESSESDAKSKKKASAPAAGSSSLKRKADEDDEEEAPAAKKARTPAGAQVTQTNPVSKRLYIGNLSFKIDDDSIKSFFDGCGEVVSVHWVTDKTTGKFYGTGFIEFDSFESAEKAMAKQGEDCLGRPIKIDYARPERSAGGSTPNTPRGGAKGGDRNARAPTPKPDGCTTVFLGNLSYEINDDKIREVLSDCGEIKQIRWVERDGKFQGCGFVEFHDTESTDKAVAHNGTDVLGRTIRIDYSAPRNRQ